MNKSYKMTVKENHSSNKVPTILGFKMGIHLLSKFNLWKDKKI